MKKPEKLKIKEINDSIKFGKVMKLSRKEIAICNIGVNLGLDRMERYYKWYIKEKCVYDEGKDMNKLEGKKISGKKITDQDVMEDVYYKILKIAIKCENYIAGHPNIFVMLNDINLFIKEKCVIKDNRNNKKVIEFTIERLPKSLNVMFRQHWSRRYDEQSKWDEWMYPQWLKFNRYIFMQPVKLVYSLYFKKSRARDKDNYIGGTKYLTDALKRTFLVKDDSRWVTDIDTKFYITEDLREYTRIRIEEV